ncbi:MAG: prolyl oligopeptidase family serine peptidase [Bowdeniella nasicola]|nr:prolyl oligopeptidase family serine peptidase [Bowdeniella nasicola]
MSETSRHTPNHPSPEPAPDLAFLDEIEGEEALTWVRARNDHTDEVLGGTSRYAELRDELLAILDSDEKIPFVRQRGDYLYNFWTDAHHERGIWRRTTWESYRSASPEWETLIDVDHLAEEEGVPWVWHGACVLYPTHDRALIDLSPGGSDADVTREFDLTTRSFIEDGFYRPEAKGSMTWADQSGDVVLVSTDFGPGTLTASGYPRIVRRVRRGQDLADGELILEGEESDIAVAAMYSTIEDRTFASRALDFYTSKSFELVGDDLVPIEVPESANESVWRDWLIVRLRDDWQVGKRCFPSGAVLATRYADFLAGGRDFVALFIPTARSSAVDLTATRHHLVLTVLEDVVTHLELLTPSGRADAGADNDGGWRRRDLDVASPLLPEAELATDRPLVTVSVAPVDAKESDDLWVTLESFTLPTTLALARLDEAGEVCEVESIHALPASFEASDVRVSQHFAVSADGTRVPYFQVAPASMPTDGSNPTLLNGYGGFEVSLAPAYLGGAGKVWVERGGVYVIANIRGGGEYGPAWHKAALKAERPRAYEDFAAVARDLVERGVTTAEHLGAWGGSNGGLLIGNMLTGYPDLFGAFVCSVPLLDMRRYTRLLAGASWEAEYGDPDDPQQWEFIQTFSPFHRFDSEASYPPILFTTSTKDDRVHPAHARTMAYRMLKAGKNVTYVENIEGGHGGASTNAQRARMSAYAYEFLWQQLG